MKLLLTNSEKRKTLDLFNILKLHFNEKDIVLTSSSNRISQVLIYSQKVIRIPDNCHGFTESLDQISLQYEFEELLFFPIEEREILYFYDYLKKGKRAGFYRYCLPSQKAFNLAIDKFFTNKICSEIGVAAPTIYNKSMLKNISEKDLPLIIKPKKGSGSIGIKYLESLDDLDELRIVNLETNIIQEKINNSSEIFGAFFLYKNGEIVSNYIHKRIKTFPTTGGVSVFSKSVDVPELIDKGNSILKHLQWEGIAMIEFLYCNKRQDYVVIEINPRIWGSILLSEKCDSRIISKYILASLNTTVSKQNTYLINKYILWLFPFGFRIFINDIFEKEKRDIAIINLTYGNFRSFFLFHLFSILSMKNLKRLVNKIVQ